MPVKLLSVVCHLLLGSCVTRSVYYRKERFGFTETMQLWGDGW